MYTGTRALSPTIATVLQHPQPLGFLKRLLPKDMDLGDIIILLILALLLIDGEESDSTTLILTVVAFLFL